MWAASGNRCQPDISVRISSSLLICARDAAQQVQVPQQWRSTGCAPIVRDGAPPQTADVWAALSAAPTSRGCALLVVQPPGMRLAAQPPRQPP